MTILKKLFLFSVLLLISSCGNKQQEMQGKKNQPKKYKVPVYSTKHIHNIIVDNKVITPFDLQYYGLSKGKHTITINGKKESFNVGESNKVLLNISRDTIIKNELIYASSNQKATDKDYSTPMRIFIFEDQLYIGPYKMFTNIVVDKWDFGLNTKVPNQIETINTESYGLPASFNRKKSSYFKIYTKEEFIKKVKSINRNNEWIKKQLDKSISKINKDYSFTIEKDNYLVVNKASEGYKRSIGKLSADADGKLTVRKAYFYKRKKHGRVTKQIALIKNCYKETDSIKKKYTMAVVLSDKSKHPHLKVIK